ncbi:carboxylesterase 5A-like [Saccostrea echinata]|uniref:carboxylesterase 5A-like n=1 Tax=Saccostrea echinata TaxID=191078 RepID=UPI002A823E21|nr:carboxylesterase 5A-like [Saccostrea echinata]
MGSKGALTFLFTMFLSSTTYITDITTRESEVEIQTRLGNVIGVRHTSFIDKRTIFKFLDIPYGKAPVGQLRFQKPQHFGAWSKTLNATTLGPVCYQSQNQSTTYPGFTEDCLKLNIYVPNDINSSNSKSVMVWFHGGAFTFGSGGMFDGSMLSLVGDVIVVTINYRLGIFGFFASRNNKAKGNAGLWDQKMALNWIRYNIKDYGGNPDDITIFGESAGGSSVSLQSLIPSNRGLFHRVIAQSGTANSHRVVSNATISTIAVGKKVGCTYNYHSGNDQNFVECLKAVDAIDLVKAMDIVWMDLGLNALVTLPFSPTVDGELIRKDPIHLLTDRSSPEFNFFQSLDMMIGICDNDGSLAMSFLPLYQSKLNFNFSEGVPTSELCNVIVPVFSKSLYNSSGDVSNAICKKYSAVNNIEEQGREFLHMHGDATFIAPAALALEYHANSIQGTTTYQYVFADELPSNNPLVPSWYRGSAHGTDVFYLFFYEQVKTKYVWPNGADVLVKQMRQYWTNFAKTGNPNGQGLPNWNPFDDSTLHPYMNLQSLMTSMGTKYRKTYIDLWNKELPNILQNRCNLRSCVMPVVG